jgi:hypothetical protein
MVRLLLAALTMTSLTVMATNAQEPTQKKGGPAIGHMVYFKLKDPTPANVKKLVAACDKYLSTHEGTLYYAAGVLSQSLNREVNDRDWDVALHLVFVNKAAHDVYNTHPEHLKFIEENKEMWEKVRVFDSEFTPTKKAKKATKE